MFNEVQDPPSFLLFLQKLPEKKEDFYQEGNTIFAVEVMEKRKGASLFSLEEVLKKGILQKKIEDLLLVYYKELERTNPSLFKDKGVKKNFSEVKQDLASLSLAKGGSFYSMTKEFYESKLRKEETKKPFFLEEKELWIEEGSPFFKEALSKKEGEFSKLSTVEGISFFTVLKKKEDDSIEKKERALLRNQGKLQLVKHVFGG